MNEKPRPYKRILGAAVATIGFLIAVVGLIYTIMQFYEDRQREKNEDRANATAVTLWGAQLKVQETIAALQALNVQSGPTATYIAQELSSLQQTKTVLEAGSLAAWATLTAVWQERNPDVPTSTPALPFATAIPNNPAVTYTPSAASMPAVVPVDVMTNFGSSGALFNDWTWNQGQVQESSYQISDDGGTISIIAGPRTDMWSNKTSAPTLEHSLSGNFTITAKITFTGTEEWQVAGISLRPEDDPTTWIGVRRASAGDTQQTAGVVQTRNNSSEGVTTIPYAKQDVYYKISRVNDLLSFWVSENGVNWFNLITDYVFSMPADLKLFFYVYSTSANGFRADFSELSIGKAVGQTAFLPTGNTSFSDETSGQLSNLFGWYPGASSSSAFRITDGTLTVITGPRTDFWDAKRSAPFVAFPVTGNFQAQVRVNFEGTEEYQTAGFGLLSGSDWSNWIGGRRTSAGGNRQFVEASRALDNRSDSPSSISFSENVVYFQLRREEPLISIYYSTDGSSWTPLIEEFVMGFPETNYLIFYVYSTTSHGIQAGFSDFIVTAP